MTFAAGLPFKEAIAYAEARKVVLPGDYFGPTNALHRGQSVSIAGLAELNQIKFVIDQLNATLKSGGTFASFKKAVEANTLGIDLPEYRLDNIFRTNIQSAYNKGRWEQQQSLVTKPYLMYDAVNDSRTRPTHAAWDNTVLPKEHPFWGSHYPPNGYRCRCVVIPLTQKQAERRGITVSRNPGEPDEGFEGNPGLYEESNNRLLRKAVNQAEAVTKTSVARQVAESLKNVEENTRANKLLSTLLAESTDSVEQLSSLRTLTQLGKFLKTATPTDAALLIGYSRNKFEGINNLMRKASLTVAEGLVLDYIVSVFKAVNVKATNQIQTLYRGLNAAGITDKILATHAKGSVVELASLASTSKKQFVARKFMGDVDSAFITFINAKGTGADFSKLSIGYTEQEVVLVPGTMYKVLQVKNQVSLETGRQAITIEAEIVKSAKITTLFEHRERYSIPVLRRWNRVEPKL
jgi:SPP1 gp7 family putative phage head morphogenesis protein